jgi:hypothetical protein
MVSQPHEVASVIMQAIEELPQSTAAR